MTECLVFLPSLPLTHGTPPLLKAAAAVPPPSSASSGAPTPRRGVGRGKSASTSLDLPTVAPQSSPGSGSSLLPTVSMEAGRASQFLSDHRPHSCSDIVGRRSHLDPFNQSIQLVTEYGDPYSGCEGNDSVSSFQCGGGECSHTPEQLSDTS